MPKKKKKKRKKSDNWQRDCPKKGQCYWQRCCPKKIWVIALFCVVSLSIFFFFNLASFFNKGIWVNLFKLIFSIPPPFHSKPNKKERIKSFPSSHNFLSSHFSTPPTKRTIKLLKKKKKKKIGGEFEKFCNRSFIFLSSALIWYIFSRKHNSESD